MKIGLLDIDCHAAKKKWGATVYPNLALCKIAAWHKQQGDTVEWATPFEHYDIIGYHYWLFEDAIARIDVPEGILDKYANKYA